MPDNLPQQIGNYRIVRRIADRGVVQSYEAIHQHLKRKTFLKVYLGGDASLLQRFEREASIVASITSDALVQIYDFGEDGGRYFIAMEFVEGENLESYWQRPSLTLHHKIALAYRIARSVAVLHQHGIVHRDLKPANILVTTDGQVKITDFGLATQESLSAITHGEGMLGTPLYMAPEQINNLPPTPAVDVFALGIIFYQLFSGNHPFYAEQMSTVLANILTLEPEDLSRKVPELPTEVSRLVARMLQKNPEQRPQTAAEVANQLAPLVPEVAQSEGDVSQKASMGEPLPRSGKRWQWASLVGGLVVLIIGLTWWWKEMPEPLPLPEGPDSSRVPSAVVDSSRGSGGDTAATSQPIAATEPDHGNASPPVPPSSSPPDNELPPATQPPAMATLLIKTFPWCRVYLDYQFIDVTPMNKPLTIASGKYLLSLQNPNYPTYMDSIEVKPGRLNVFTYHLDSLFVQLKLVVVPWGDVFVDGVKVGTTPLAQPILLTRRPHVLEIKNEFYQTHREVITPGRERVIERKIVLKERPISGADG